MRAKTKIQPFPASTPEPWWLGETVVALHDLPGYLPRRANGAPVSPKTVQRWSRAGVAGVRLRVFCWGGRGHATTLEELGRWQEALTRLLGAGQ